MTRKYAKKNEEDKHRSHTLTFHNEVWKKARLISVVDHKSASEVMSELVEKEYEKKKHKLKEKVN
jgi:hypothetical protein